MTTAVHHVLIVDDEPELRSLLTEYLGRHGFAMHAAHDAAAARASIAARVPDLVVLDVNMPGENGLSLARRLRETHPQVGIVLLTTQGEAVDRIIGLEFGADDYLPKPFEVRELLARVRTVLRRAAVRVAALAEVMQAATRQVRFGACRLDLDQRQLFSNRRRRDRHQLGRVRPASAVRPPSEPAAES